MNGLIENLANSLLNKAPFHETVAVVRNLIAYLLKEPNNLSTGWHPYGFLVIKLDTRSDASPIRLHIWPISERTKQVPDWPVHSHPWELHSRVLAGSLVNELYEVDEGVTAGDNLIYDVRYKNNTSILEATQIRATCQKISEESFFAGQDYHVAQNDYHFTYVSPDIFASTVVHTTNFSNTPPRVVGKTGFEGSYSFERQTCEISVLRRLLQELAVRLKN